MDNTAGCGLWTREPGRSHVARRVVEESGPICSYERSPTPPTGVDTKEINVSGRGSPRRFTQGKTHRRPIPPFLVSVLEGRTKRVWSVPSESCSPLEESRRPDPVNTQVQDGVRLTHWNPFVVENFTCVCRTEYLNKRPPQVKRVQVTNRVPDR